MKKWIAVSLAILVVLVAAGMAFYFVPRNSEDTGHQQQVESIADAAEAIVADVQEKVSSKAPVIWVYDRDENFIMTLKVSTILGSVDSIPEYFIQEIKGAGNIYALAARKFLGADGEADPLTVEGYALRLQRDFDEEVVSRYLAISSTYAGKYEGIVSASIELFGKEPSQLNEVQYGYLAYAMNNPEATTETYCVAKGISVELLNADYLDSYSVLRTYVMQELQGILGDSLPDKNYSVKLAYSLSQSSALQTVVDRECRSLTQLATDGSYALNCSVVAVDRSTGFVRVMSPSRSGNKGAQKILSMSTSNLESCFVELRNNVDAGLLRNSLMEVTLPNGDKVLQSLEERFTSGTLYEYTATAQSSTVFSLITAMFGCNAKDLHFVYQIISDGNKVYEVDPKNPIDFNSPGMYEFFSSPEDKQLTGRFSKDLPSGSIEVYFTADYIMAAMVGSGAIGVEVPVMQYDLFHSILSNVRGTVATWYPTPKNIMWDTSLIEVARQEVYTSNTQYVLDLFNEQFEDLSSLVIDSSTKRVQFEDSYAKLSKLVSEYESYVGVSFTEDLRSRLSALWSERSALLIQYSV